MKKAQSYIKNVLKAILYLALIFVLLFAIITMLIQIPVIQNKVIHYVTTLVSNKTHTKVEIKYISISFPKSVVIESLYLEDFKKDTLLYAGKAKINIALKDLLSNKISINNLKLEDVLLNANRSLNDSLFNFDFLINAFSNTANKTKVKPQSTSKWTYKIDNVIFKNIRFRYDDEYGGLKIAVVLGNLELNMNIIDLEKSVYAIDELFTENVSAQVQIKSCANPNTKKSESIFPKITANKMQTGNSTVSYGDSVRKQSVFAVINQIVLKGASVDLQKEIISFDNLYLSKSEINYFSVDSVVPSVSKVVGSIAAPGNNWKVIGKNIRLDDNSIAYQIGNKPEIKKVFDVNNLKYTEVTLEAINFNYSLDTTDVSIKNLSAIDHNNFNLSNFETDFSMGKHSITAKNLIVKTPNSTIDADLNLKYSSLETLKDSFQSLNLNLNLRNISINNSDILYFNPKLSELEYFKNVLEVTTISGTINGKVNNLTGKNIVIKTGANSGLKTDFSIIGLTDTKTASFSFPNMEIITGRKDIEMMAGQHIPKNVELPDKISMDIVFKGKLKSFKSNMSMRSSYGDANLFVTVDQDENFRSKVSLSSFDLGGLLKDTVMYGPVSLISEANGHGLERKTIRAKIKAEVSQIYLNKYTYHNLHLEGNINGQEFAGMINLNDENVVFDFDGLVNLNPDQEQYKFRLNLQGADLQKLHITKDNIRIGLVSEADLKGGAVNKLNGKVRISSLILAKGDKKYQLDSLLFVSVNEPNKSEFNFNSAIIGVKYNGTISPIDISAELNNFINNYFPFSDGSLLKKKSEPSKFNFEIQLHNHPILSQFLLPQLKEFEPGLIVGSFDSQKSELKLNATMKKIIYGDTEIKDFVLDVNSNSTALDYKISGSSISNSQIRLDNLLFDGKLTDKTIFAGISLVTDDHDKKLVIRSQIKKDNANYKLTIDPKDFYLMNSRWDIAADNYFEFGKEGFFIHHFFINNSVSQINIASAHDQFNDDLNFAIKNFKLDDISRIVEKDTSLVKGNVDGNVLLKRVDKTWGIIADAKITDLVVREIPVGNISVKADNPTAGKFDIDLNLSGNDNNMTVNGYFIPNGGDNSINVKILIKSLSLKTIEAFSMRQLTEAAGTLAGNIIFEGSADTPGITGELVFNDAFIKPAVLNNRLELKHETVLLKNDGVYFKSFKLLDSEKHTASIDGSVQMVNFSNFNFNLHISTQDFLLLNTTAKDNKEFYGRMVIDSKIDVTGPFSLPVVNARLKMKKGSDFTFAVPEEKLSTDKGEDVVEFENPKNINSILDRAEKKGEQKSRITGLDLTSIIEIDKQATLRLLLDPSSTDSLVVKGEAALSFTIDQSGKISLAGAYNLSEGSYLVSLESVIKKKFSIDPGSTIIWNGDPLDAEISINARYSVRASPFDLVADQISGLSDIDKGGYKQRYPFLVILKLRGEILHPEISFEIQLLPVDKGILGGAVNQKLIMLNEDPSALNKQVFALLVLGRFVQENPFQTETGGTSTLIRSTVGKFLSVQLNQLSSKVLPGVDLNFDIQSYDDYQTGQAVGRTQVEIGIKKQLFNERLSVQLGGTLDVEGDMAKQNSASDITSDIEIEYKLTEDGRFRIKGFRHNQYEGAIEGQLVETGAGVIYVRDFNKWKEFFFSPKSKSDLLQKTKK